MQNAKGSAAPGVLSGNVCMVLNAVGTTVARHGRTRHTFPNGLEADVMHALSDVVLRCTGVLFNDVTPCVECFT